MKEKSSFFNLNGNITILIAYLGGLIFKWIKISCYFCWLIPLIIYLIENKNEVVKKQSAQATFLFSISSAISIIVYLFLIIFAPTSTEDIYHMIVTGSLLLVGLVSLLSVAVAILVTYFSVLVILKTYQYEDYNIPYLSRYLDKFISYLEVLEGKNNKKNKDNYEEQEEPYKKARPHKIRINKTTKIKRQKATAE